jgi:hypothetical protein
MDSPAPGPAPVRVTVTMPAAALKPTPTPVHAPALKPAPAPVPAPVATAAAAPARAKVVVPATSPDPGPAPATAPPPRARIVGEKPSAQAQQASVLPALVPNTLPPHDWEAIERRKKLAQRRSAESSKRMHAVEERRQAHLENLKKELLRAEAIEAPLQPTFFTPPKTRGANHQRRSSFGDRLCPPKEHVHQRSLSREKQSAQTDLRGCTFKPVIYTRQQKRGHGHGAGKRAPAGAANHKDDDSVSSLSSGSSAGAAHGSSSSGNKVKDAAGVFSRNYEFGQIYKSRREKLAEELRKTVRVCGRRVGSFG